MRRNLALTPLMVILAAGGSAHAQDLSTAVLAGRVTSESDGSPIQGVRIIIESSALLGPRQGVTDANGSFRVPLLPNGEYTITYSMNGFITRKLTTRLIAGQTANANTRMTPIGVQTVTVDIIATTGGRVQIDKTDTIVQTSYDANLLEKITGGRGINAVGSLAPGINTGTLTDQGRITIRGGTDRSTKLLVDGATTTEMWGGYTLGTFNVGDLIESVAVIQSPINSRYGNTDGGLVTMVTSKGSNTFKGSLRTTLSRGGGWGTRDRGYGWRDNTLYVPTNSPITTPDNLAKSYTGTLQGPLWKDRVTFAWGGTFQPLTAYTSRVSSHNGTNSNLWTEPNPLANNRVGTFYVHQVNPTGSVNGNVGDVIRNPEMYLYNDVDGRLSGTRGSNMNQFTVFAQITPQHTLEYNYSQTGTEWNASVQNLMSPDGGWAAEYGDFAYYDNKSFGWNMAYKGIIGASGVLEARHGKNQRRWAYGKPSHTAPPIATGVIASRIPMAGDYGSYWNQPGAPIYSTNNFDDYLANGYVGAFATNTPEWVTDVTNYNLGSGHQVLGHNNVRYGPGDAGGTIATVINYQHFLNTKRGNHLIDVGLQFDESYWTKNTVGGAPVAYYAMGQIAYNLDPRDIYNPSGITAPVSAYAGKYIVFNAELARFSDVDPWGVARYGMHDRQFIDGTTVNLSTIIPRMTERWGEGSGSFWANMRSYYVNDLWSINDNHSVQGGLRVDVFNLEDMGKELLKYSQPTLRFEYKWDVDGDSRRVLSVSWAQFHSQQPSSVYSAMLQSAGDYSRVRYWNKGTAQPYLVDKEELTNPDNYGHYMPTASTAGPHLFKVADDWKAPLSTEYAVGFRRNLDMGGFWKASVVYRTWINDFDWYAGDPITINDQLNLTRILRNNSGYERKHTGFELEWDLPIHKRINFGGSYTYSRTMTNEPSIQGQGGQNAISSGRFNMSSWWDEVFSDPRVLQMMRDQGYNLPDGVSGRDLWSPVWLLNPEHYFKWYLLFDMSSKRLTQTVSFTGNYTSIEMKTDGYTWQFGKPYKYYSDYMQGPNGGRPSNAVADISGMWASQASGIGVYVPFSTMTTNNSDTWNLNMRYQLSVPIAKTLSWQMWVNISNPFNHRARTLNVQANGPYGSNVTPEYLAGGNGTQAINPHVNPYNGKMVPRFTDSQNTINQNFYTGHWNGRSISLETGIRF